MPQEYLWSSAHAHLEGMDNDLMKVDPLLALITE